VSGIGAGSLLQRLGVAVVHDLQGVGGNLQDHLQTRSVFKCTRPTLNDEVNNFINDRVINYYKYRLDPMGGDDDIRA